MSKTNTLILGMLFFASSLWGQLASWPLTTDNSPTAVVANITATDLVRGNGIGPIQFSPEGGKARGWTSDASANQVDYYEVCLSPDAGYVLHVTDLNFSEMRTDQGIRNYEVLWSTNNFETSENILSASIPDDASERSTNISGLDIYACEGESLCFRWYGYNAEHGSGEWRINDNSLNIHGTVNAACTPPATAASGLSFGNLNTTSMQVNFAAGNGNSRLVVMKQGSAVTALPCSGASYSDNASFGAGDEIGLGEFIVYNGTGTSVDVTDLIEGADYHVAVFEYNNSGNCYKRISPAIGNQSTLCFSPSNVTGNIGSPGDGIVTLAWERPACFDEVLIIASTSSIVGLPAGNGSNYNPMPEYGLGSDAGNDFAGAEFPIYQGIGTELEVTGLTNETVYFFKIFTRKGTDWSSGIEYAFKPTEGCTDLGGNDVVFINELHYRNVGTDQDEGVEVYGPAGTKLELYQLIPYNGVSGHPISIIDLSGPIDDEGDGYGARWFAIPDMEDGKGGVALYNKVTQETVHFISYRGAFTAASGPAQGETATNVTRFENAITAVGYSIQLSGSGNCPADLTWIGPLPNTMGFKNSGQLVLPIELVDFYGTIRGDQILLNWETAIEIDNDFMEVQRSQDGVNFEAIGEVKGAGNSEVPQYYSFLDTRPFNGINYYRLRQVDFDGSSAFHKVIALDMRKETLPMEVFPTLTKEHVTVRFGEELLEETILTVYNLTGQLMQQQTLDEKTLEHQLDVSRLQPGQYLLRIESGGIVHTARITKF